PDFLMTIHANLGRGKAREFGVFDSGVTIAAVDAQAVDVMLMAKRHRLIADNAHAGDVIGAHIFGPRPAQPSHDEDAAEDADLGKRIEATVENLSHASSAKLVNSKAESEQMRCQALGGQASQVRPIAPHYGGRLTRRCLPAKVP